MKSVIIDASNLRHGGGVQVASSFIRDLYSENLILEIIADEVKIMVSKQVFENIKPYEKSSEIVLVGGGTRLQDQPQTTLVFQVFGPRYVLFKRATWIIGFAQPWIAFPNNEVYGRLKWYSVISKKIKYWIQWRLFQKSDVLIVEADHVKNALLYEYANHRNIVVIKNTISSVFFNFKGSERIERSEVVIAYIGRDYVHKNLAVIDELINRIDLKDLGDVRFITTLTKEEARKYSEKFQTNIEHKGPVTISDLPDFYDSVDIVLFPSLLECSSATPMEALYMNKEILASDRSFIKDVCEERATYFDPLDSEDLENKLKIILNRRGSKKPNDRSDWYSSLDRTRQYISIINKYLN